MPAILFIGAGLVISVIRIIVKLFRINAGIPLLIAMLIITQIVNIRMVEYPIAGETGWAVALQLMLAIGYGLSILVLIKIRQKKKARKKAEALAMQLPAMQLQAITAQYEQNKAILETNRAILQQLQNTHPNPQIAKIYETHKIADEITRMQNQPAQSTVATKSNQNL